MKSMITFKQRKSFLKHGLKGITQPNRRFHRNTLRTLGKFSGKKRANTAPGETVVNNPPKPMSRRDRIRAYGRAEARGSSAARPVSKRPRHCNGAT